MVVDAMAGRAGFPMRVCRRREPLPAALMKHRAALRADGGLRQLGLGFVGIVHTLLEEAVMALDLAEAARNSCVFHGSRLLWLIAWLVEIIILFTWLVEIIILFNRHTRYISVSPMTSGCSSPFGRSAIIASVVRIRLAIETAFCRAQRVTLAGSRMPISIRSPYSSVAAL